MLCSALFLVNYIFYHLAVGHISFTNESFKIPYYIILITHLLMSVISLPLVFLTYAFGFLNRLQEHKKIAKITFFAWEYVSITGVIIVLCLKFLN